MRVLKQFMMIAGFSLFAATAWATPAAPQSGIDYTTLAKAQPTDAGKKIEVIEFFDYFCSHCYALDPGLSKWVAAQGDKIVFKRVQVRFNPNMASLQQAYATLEVMNKADAMHGKIFGGVQQFKLRLDKRYMMTEFLRQLGIDKKKYQEMYSSFAVQTRLRRHEQLANAYVIEQVPQLVVDGRFMTSPAQVRTGLGPQAGKEQVYAATVQVLDALVAKASSERK
jgi:thiol:disulfide interchange protein DsbA